jgi:hypothetical protein
MRLETAWRLRPNSFLGWSFVRVVKIRVARNSRWRPIRIDVNVKADAPAPDHFYEDLDYAGRLLGLPSSGLRDPLDFTASPSPPDPVSASNLEERVTKIEAFHAERDPHVTGGDRETPKPRFHSIARGLFTDIWKMHSRESGRRITGRVLEAWPKPDDEVPENTVERPPFETLRPFINGLIRAARK